MRQQGGATLARPKVGPGESVVLIVGSRLVGVALYRPVQFRSRVAGYRSPQMAVDLELLEAAGDTCPGPCGPRRGWLAQNRDGT